MRKSNYEAYLLMTSNLKKPLTPDAIDKHLGVGPYASRHMTHLRVINGLNIVAKKDGRSVLSYTLTEKPKVVPSEVVEHLARLKESASPAPAAKTPAPAATAKKGKKTAEAPAPVATTAKKTNGKGKKTETETIETAPAPAAKPVTARKAKRKAAATVETVLPALLGAAADGDGPAVAVMVAAKGGAEVSAFTVDPDFDAGEDIPDFLRANKVGVVLARLAPALAPETTKKVPKARKYIGNKK